MTRLKNEMKNKLLLTRKGLNNAMTRLKYVARTYATDDKLQKSNNDQFTIFNSTILLFP